MRPGQNKRMRGRNTNRKGPNPLSRSYESNGPDVKIRGTAHHVAEKYLQLARDAQTSGDPVMAESYLQHAEHYFRIIAAAQTAQLQSQQGAGRPGSDVDLDDGDDDDDFGGLPDRFASPATPERFAPQQINAPQPNFGQQAQPQPYADRPSYNGNGGGGPDRGPQDRGPQDRGPQDRGPSDRQNFGGDRPNQDRYDRPRGDRPYQDRQGGGPRDNRNNRDYGRPPRNDRNEAPRQDRFEPRGYEPRATGNSEVPRAAGASTDQPRPAPQTSFPESEPPTGLPSFITAPVRPLPPLEADHAIVNGAHEDTAPDVVAEEGGQVRQRRRRRARPSFSEGGGDAAQAASNGGGEPTTAHRPVGENDSNGEG